jgi:hypothetical protein
MLIRPRRPIARLATTAAVGGLAYSAGKSKAQQQQTAAQAQAAYDATQAQQQQAAIEAEVQRRMAEQQASQPQQQPQQSAAAEDPTIAKIQELGKLHQQGLLSDEEFAAAKARVLGTGT